MILIFLYSSFTEKKKRERSHLGTLEIKYLEQHYCSFQAVRNRGFLGLSGQLRQATCSEKGLGWGGFTGPES